MRPGVCICVLAALAVTWALAAEEPLPGAPAVEMPFGRPDMPPARAGRPDLPAEPAVSAEETPELVLGPRGPIPVTPPTEAIAFKIRPRAAVPESLILDGRCRLIPDTETGWFRLEFLDVLPSGFPSQIYVLPGRELELLEAQAAEDDQVQFRVTGQTTSYLGTPYVLPLSIARELPAAQPPEPPAPQVADPTPPQPSPTSAPASGNEGDRVRSRLLKDRPARPVVAVVPLVESNGEGESDPSAPPAAVAPAGDILIDRIVRIARAPDGQWMEAHFEADNTLQERPVPLLPCRVLERAETIEGKTRITGILRRYKGRSYLLLRKALSERDMGQL